MCTTARSRATICSSAPPGMRPSTCGSCMSCWASLVSHRASRCPTSRACPCRPVSGDSRRSPARRVVEPQVADDLPEEPHREEEEGGGGQRAERWRLRLARPFFRPRPPDCGRQPQDGAEHGQKIAGDDMQGEGWAVGDRHGGFLLPSISYY